MKKWTGDVVFLLIIGALVAGWLRLYPGPADSPFSPPETPPDLNPEALPTYASSEGLELAYRFYAPPGEVKQVLVFTHDTLLHSGWYANLGRRLAEGGTAVYLPDRRGWGRSAGTHRDVAEDRGVLTEDIMAMISVARARYPQQEIYLGGHGRGGALALSYVAAGRPVAGVVLVAPYISEDQLNLRPGGWQIFASAHPGEAYLARSGLIQWRAWRYNWPPSMVEADPLIETDYSISWMDETVPEDVAALYSAVTVPLLLVEGEADPLFDPGKAPDLLALFVSTDPQLEIIPEADALSLIDAAAGPISNWLAARR